MYSLFVGYWYRHWNPCQISDVTIIHRITTQITKLWSIELIEDIKRMLVKNENYMFYLVYKNLHDREWREKYEYLLVKIFARLAWAHLGFQMNLTESNWMANIKSELVCPSRMIIVKFWFIRMKCWFVKSEVRTQLQLRVESSDSEVILLAPNALKFTSMHNTIW